MAANRPAMLEAAVWGIAAIVGLMAVFTPP